MRHAQDKGASQLVTLRENLDLALENIFDMQQMRKGQMAAIRVTAATTSMMIGTTRPCSSLVRSTFLSAIARSTGLTIITAASSNAGREASVGL